MRAGSTDYVQQSICELPPLFLNDVAYDTKAILYWPNNVKGEYDDDDSDENTHDGPVVVQIVRPSYSSETTILGKIVVVISYSMST